MFCVISGKKKKNRNNFLCNGDDSQKKHPIFWALSKLKWDPLPKLILALFEKVVHIIM